MILLAVIGTCISLTFINPFAHQTNLMVIGPGGYTFPEFMRFGVPLILITRRGREPRGHATAGLTQHRSSAAPKSRKGHPMGAALSEKMSGGVLLSHTVPPAVPSALRGLASGFGMGPGVSLSLWPPKLY